MIPKLEHKSKVVISLNANTIERFKTLLILHFPTDLHFWFRKYEKNIRTRGGGSNIISLYFSEELNEKVFEHVMAGIEIISGKMGHHSHYVSIILCFTCAFFLHSWNSLYLHDNHFFSVYSITKNFYCKLKSTKTEKESRWKEGKKILGIGLINQSSISKTYSNKHGLIAKYEVRHFLIFSHYSNYQEQGI